VQLSQNTSTRQCVGIALYVEEQLRNVIDTCGCFSLQSGELTDMVNVAHLFVFIELVFEDTSTKEELGGWATHHFAINRTHQRWG